MDKVPVLGISDVIHFNKLWLVLPVSSLFTVFLKRELPLQSTADLTAGLRLTTPALLASGTNISSFIRFQNILQDSQRYPAKMHAKTYTLKCSIRHMFWSTLWRRFQVTQGIDACTRHSSSYPGKTRTHCGGNIANEVMFPKY